MDSINNRGTQAYAAREEDAGAQEFGRIDPEPYPADVAGSIGTMGQSAEAPDSTPSVTTRKTRASSSAAAGTDSAATEARSTKRKKQSGSVAEQAEQKADAGMQMSAEGLKKAADMTRSMTEEHSGAMGSIGSQAADVMEKGAGYLEQSDTDRMIQDLEAMIRRRPMESLLVAAGAGFLLSKAMR